MRSKQDSARLQHEEYMRNKTDHESGGIQLYVEMQRDQVKKQNLQTSDMKSLFIRSPDLDEKKAILR